MPRWCSLSPLRITEPPLDSITDVTPIAYDGALKNLSPNLSLALHKFPELVSVIEMWPGLTGPARTSILSLVQGCGAKQKGC